MRNPIWTRQETELLVNMYFDLKDRYISIFQTDNEINELSRNFGLLQQRMGWK